MTDLPDDPDCMNPANKVLVVDDDPAVLRLLSTVLGAAGYGVLQAADGFRALELVETELPDFVVTDWDMPGMDGPQVCRRIRAMPLPKYVYLLFLTGNLGADAAIAGLGAGADDFMTKPIVPGILLARLRSGGRVLEMAARLRDLAHNDGLTGIPTRRSFHERLVAEFERSRRHRVPVSCVMLDVDYFKKVNDTYGHPAGDEVLKAVASVLVDARRAADVVSRYGGEEFCALLPETDEAGAAIWAERVRVQLAGTSIPVGDRTVQVTASLGVAQALDDMRSVEVLIDHADQALLTAKQSGRDRVVPYSAVADHSLVAVEASEDPFAGVLARDVMAYPVPSLRQIETIGQAAEFFYRFRINSAPVIDEQGQLVGVLSERDVLSVMLAKNPWTTQVRDVMKTNVVSYEDDAPIRRIYDFLCRVALRRVVIVKDGQPKGMIGRRNLLRWYHHWLSATGHRTAAHDVRRQANDRRRAHAHMDDTAAQLAAQASLLRDHLAARREDIVPLVVDRVSAMQELLDDLLTTAPVAADIQGETQIHCPSA